METIDCPECGLANHLASQTCQLCEAPLHPAADGSSVSGNLPASTKPDRNEDPEDEGFDEFFRLQTQMNPEDFGGTFAAAASLGDDAAAGGGDDEDELIDLLSQEEKAPQPPSLVRSSSMADCPLPAKRQKLGEDGAAAEGGVGSEGAACEADGGLVGGVSQLTMMIRLKNERKKKAAEALASAPASLDAGQMLSPGHDGCALDDGHDDHRGSDAGAIAAAPPAPARQSSGKKQKPKAGPQAEIELLSSSSDEGDDGPVVTKRKTAAKPHTSNNPANPPLRSYAHANRHRYGREDDDVDFVEPDVPEQPEQPEEQAEGGGNDDGDDDDDDDEVVDDAEDDGSASGSSDFEGDEEAYGDEADMAVGNQAQKSTAAPPTGPVITVDGAENDHDDDEEEYWGDDGDGGANDDNEDENEDDDDEDEVVEVESDGMAANYGYASSSGTKAARGASSSSSSYAWPDPKLPHFLPSTVLVALGDAGLDTPLKGNVELFAQFGGACLPVTMQRMQGSGTSSASHQQKLQLQHRKAVRERSKAMKIAEAKAEGQHKSKVQAARNAMVQAAARSAQQQQSASVQRAKTSAGGQSAAPSSSSSAGAAENKAGDDDDEDLPWYYRKAPSFIHILKSQKPPGEADTTVNAKQLKQQQQQQQLQQQVYRGLQGQGPASSHGLPLGALSAVSAIGSASSSGFASAAPKGISSTSSMVRIPRAAGAAIGIGGFESGGQGASSASSSTATSATAGVAPTSGNNNTGWLTGRGSRVVSSAVPNPRPFIPPPPPPPEPQSLPLQKQRLQLLKPSATTLVGTGGPVPSIAPLMPRQHASYPQQQPSAIQSSAVGTAASSSGLVADDDEDGAIVIGDDDDEEGGGASNARSAGSNGRENAAYPYPYPAAASTSSGSGSGSAAMPAPKAATSAWVGNGLGLGMSATRPLAPMPAPAPQAAQQLPKLRSLPAGFADEGGFSSSSSSERGAVASNKHAPKQMKIDALLSYLQHPKKA